MPRPRPSACSASIAVPRAASNTPAISVAQGHLITTATSATPVTATASAVLNDIGCWLPKRKTAVARANQATITVRPPATHSRPPAIVIASSTRAVRDGGSAGAAGEPEGEAAGAAAGAAVDAGSVLPPRRLAQHDFRFPGPQSAVPASYT